MREIPNGIPELCKNLILDTLQITPLSNAIFNIEELADVINQFIELEGNKSNCIELSTNYIDTLIIGDIHGDVTSLNKIVSHFLEGKVNSMVFLGDYVDRGDDSLKVIITLLSLALAFPNNIQLLRGNHEDSALNRRYGFTKELYQKYPDKGDFSAIESLFDLLYEYFSLSALTPGGTICFHGGIPNGLEKIQSLQKIPKPHSQVILMNENRDEYYQYLQQVMWNDPDENMKEGYGNSKRGSNFHTFGSEVTEEFLSKSNAKRIARAHESHRGGFQNIFNGKLLHIFSSQPYFGLVKKAYIIHETPEKTTIRDLDFNEFLVL
ncbi:MAG: serine/threonine protein phosphatase [Candidatus Heimdallarchaeota archaeon]|nr:serine/threonine protein phosphatase [Candidatus Heimdallarchaeota archaeon]MDH5646035.1 serine/threonine protein phosphatase [Candidatus Heimdallarchaeota archaeon]